MRGELFRACVIGLALSSVVGCDPKRPPPAPVPDAASLRHDGGTFDASGPSHGRDAGPPQPFVDGELRRGEWTGAIIAEANVSTDRPGSTLTRLHAILQPDRLVIAVEGTIADGDALAVYVDRDLGARHGVAPSALTDTAGTLDVALAQTSLLVPDGFAMDFAWGTTSMPHASVGLDDTAGWRELARDPSHFTTISADGAPSACSATACEAAIPLDTLGGSAPRTIALFARIVRSGGGFTNQTLPEDDAARPNQVHALLTLDDAVRDAGTDPPDAGAPGGIVIDGIVGADEWAGATVFTNDIASAGIFASDSLRTLRAVRESTRIVVAIEGNVTAGDAIAMYVDHDLGGFDGVVSPTPFNDFAGALDRALSKTLFPSAELRVDFAWGTLDMNRTATPGDDRMGWREVGVNPDMFTRIDGPPSACSADACETAIDLTTLGVTTTADVAIFVRLVDATSDAVSNQTLPMDDPVAPETVTAFVVLPAP